MYWKISHRNNNCFWDLLCKVLDRYKTEIDIYEITGKEENLKLIIDSGFKKEQITLLNEHNIFKQFIFNAGHYFFLTDSDSTWEHKNKEHYIVPFFNYVKWDEELIRKLNNALISLDGSISYREGHISLSIGYERKDAYKDVFENCKMKIKNYIQKNELDESKYSKVLEYM